MAKLIDLSDNTRTDKNNTYLDLYDSLFLEKKRSTQNILEIGIGKGGSIKLWYDYFPNAQIYGLDSMQINDVWNMIQYSSRIPLLTSINAYDETFVMENFYSKNKNFDIIIDDGSHQLKDAIQFIQLYAPLLTHDGTLIVEHVESWEWIKQLIRATPIELQKYIYTYDLKDNNIVFTIQNSKHRNQTIILTSTVNVTSNTSFQVDKQERINTYLKSVRLWLQKTNFNIVFVENSGYNFEELKEEFDLYNYRLEFFTFIPPIEPHLSNSKGGLELQAIHHAFEQSMRARHSLFIVKVTGRFFIPEFEKYLLNYNLHEIKAFTQHNTHRCEFVGCHILHFDYIFNKTQLKSEHSDSDPHIENVYHYRFSKLNNVLHAKIFDIEPTQRGGLNEKYTYL